VPEQFTLRLAASRMLAPNVRHLTFERTDGAPFAFVPGQFMHVHFHYADGTPAKRCYSVATIGAGDGSPVQRIEFAVSCVVGGAASTLLGGLAEGGTIQASGPYGRFCLMDNDANRRYLLIATGTGVAPYRAMLPQLKTLFAKRDVEVALIHGVRDEAELLYADEFEAFARAHPQFRFYACCSRTPRAQPRAHDRHGRVRVALDEIRPDAARDIAYLCGNPDMVDQTFNLLKDAGFAMANIRRERYVSLR
jgi:ferredoxin-NADP reductase